LKIRNLQDLRVFVLAADSGSLSTAAQMLELSPAVASSSLKRLESDLGAILLVRSTRSLRLSPEGERLLPAARCAPWLN
jgi:DNA-binding transcriptional LysR family regulator